MVDFPGRQATILVVEDDAHVLSFMESSLSLSGFHVLTARSCEEGFAHCRHTGLDKLGAILCDYRLPDRNGLELLRWVREQDGTLASCLITGQGEKTIVQQSLSLGVFQYIEKPVTHQELRDVMRKAVQHTRRLRQSVEDRQGLEDLGKLDQRMSSVIPDELRDRLEIFYQPLHEVGGDFCITHRYAPDEWVILVGDVSGHDIKSGYVSTYFQGMFRGCVESGAKVEDFLDLFNRVLRKQGDANRDGEVVSLSLSALHVNLGDNSLRVWNFGAPPSYFVSAEGFIRESPYGSPPLGWLSSIKLGPTHIPCAQPGRLVVFTDGLVELADQLDINFFSLLYRLGESRKYIYDLPIPPKDDILFINYSINPQFALKQPFQPIVSEHYAGSEVEQIDYLQSNWRRSLNFALDDRLGDRLYDLLICIREGMLNALVHGCEKASDKFAHLQISLSEDKSVVRVVIDDPGRGHVFDLQKRLEEINTATGKHLGLGIIQHLSDEFHIENKGTSLVFDFEINPSGA